MYNFDHLTNDAREKPKLYFIGRAKMPLNWIMDIINLLFFFDHIFAFFMLQKYYACLFGTWLHIFVNFLSFSLLFFPFYVFFLFSYLKNLIWTKTGELIHFCHLLLLSNNQSDSRIAIWLYDFTNSASCEINQKIQHTSTHSRSVKFESYKNEVSHTLGSSYLPSLWNWKVDHPFSYRTLRLQTISLLH